MVRLGLASLVALVLVACGDDATTDPDAGPGIVDAGGDAGDPGMDSGPVDTDAGPTPLDPDTAPVVAIDRFSPEAGTFHDREVNPTLPDPDEAIDFDAMFLRQGLGPGGETVQYYDFDVMPTITAPMLVLYREGEMTPVTGQLNIFDTLPGDSDYNDFWRINRVTVPADYVANTVTSSAGVLIAGYPVEETDFLVNCPFVPQGSTAVLRGGMESSDPIRGWYRDEVVYYFSFEEAQLTVDATGRVPLGSLYVTFNINPGMPGGGGASGFMTEMMSSQTHNVVSALPADMGYSPLWAVQVYDNAAFDMVSNLSTAEMATILAMDVANLNCPVVSVVP